MTSPSQLHAAAVSFSITPSLGSAGAGHAATGSKIAEVRGPLTSTIILLADSYSRVCIVTSSVPVHTVEMRMAIMAAGAETLGLHPEQILNLCSHNHCVPAFVESPAPLAGAPLGFMLPSRLNALGLEFIASLRSALATLPARLVPVTVEWGKSQETRITYNRRGRRPDGRAYFIREEDRLLLGDDYVGEIDPDAVVVLLRGLDAKAVAALAFFTGHPVTAYRPERMVVFGEWPQVACELLSARLEAPVGFLQGCAGDINSKHMLTGTVEQSERFGHFLAESFQRAVEARRPSARGGLRRQGVTAEIPFAPLPPESVLRSELEEIDRFIARGRAGDVEALECVGLNFPQALTPPYRARLIEMVRPWYEWALQTTRAGLAGGVPEALSVDISIVRIGDVGIVAMPFEPFVRTGFKIKEGSPLPCTLPCGYSGGFAGLERPAYIADATACGDREYMAGFHRYTKNRPPFAPPAGDVAAEAALRGLREISP